MKTQQNSISNTRISRIRQQGYSGYSNEEIRQLAFGNRFAYILCTSILTIGVVTSNIPILIAMMTIAFLSIILPNHVFDYIYNYLIRKSLNKPKVPPRSRQLKFACTIATLFIGTTIILFANGFTTVGYIVGGMLVSVASLVSTVDYCIPSIIYNRLFNIRV